MHCKSYTLAKRGWQFMIILYIGNVGYPDTASSIHVRNRAIFMKSCGHEVHILCELASDGKRMEEVDEVTYQYMDPYPGRGKVRGAFWGVVLAVGSTAWAGAVSVFCSASVFTGSAPSFNHPFRMSATSCAFIQP